MINWLPSLSVPVVISIDLFVVPKSIQIKGNTEIKEITDKKIYLKDAAIFLDIIFLLQL